MRSALLRFVVVALSVSVLVPLPPAPATAAAPSADAVFRATFDNGSGNGFQPGSGWAAAVTGDAQGGAGALVLTRQAGSVERTTAATASVLRGDGFVQGWLRGTPGRQAVLVAGPAKSATVTLDGTWQAVGVTVPPGGQAPLRIGVQSVGPWSPGDRLLLDTVTVTASGPTTTSVQAGSRLLLRNGVEFVAKGYNYVHTPIGHAYPGVVSWAVDPAICQRDARLLAGSGVNLIRVWLTYREDQANGLACLDAMHANGIGVLWYVTPINDDPTAFGNPQLWTDEYWEHYKTFVQWFGTHPASMFWNVGNEVEISSVSPEGKALWFGNVNGSPGILNELIRRTRVEVPHSLVGTSASSYIYCGSTLMETVNVPQLQYWGINEYPANPVLSTRVCHGQPMMQYLNSVDARPKIMTEFGVDRYNCSPVLTRDNGTGGQRVYSCSSQAHSGEDQAGQMAETTGVWDDVAPYLATAANPSGTFSGGLIFQWSDTWWGSLAFLEVTGTPETHDVIADGPRGEGGPDGLVSSEWLAVNHAQTPEEPSLRVTTATFDALSARWRSGTALQLSNVAVDTSQGCGAVVIRWSTAQPATSELQAGEHVIGADMFANILSDSTLFRRIVYDETLRTSHSITFLLPAGVTYSVVPRSFAADGRSATTTPIDVRCM